MNSKDITLWIEERWYDALNRHLKDETLEERLEKTIDEMCRQLPGRAESGTPGDAGVAPCCPLWAAVRGFQWLADRVPHSELFSGI